MDELESRLAPLLDESSAASTTVRDHARGWSFRSRFSMRPDSVCFLVEEMADEMHGGVGGQAGYCLEDGQLYLRVPHSDLIFVKNCFSETHLFCWRDSTGRVQHPAEARPPSPTYSLTFADSPAANYYLVRGVLLTSQASLVPMSLYDALFANLSADQYRRLHFLLDKPLPNYYVRTRHPDNLKQQPEMQLVYSEILADFQTCYEAIKSQVRECLTKKDSFEQVITLYVNKHMRDM